MNARLRWGDLLMVIGMGVFLCVSSPTWGEDAECIDHGVIEFAGQELGAAQCGDLVVFSDATAMGVPGGHVLIRINNAFYFYAPSLDEIIDLNPVERVPLAEASP